jgi:diguanylate cyclase (GGDEF)-like protein/PAS domain S-box-containing protein
LRALTEHALDIVAILDADGIIRYESPSLNRILGWKPNELTGRSSLEHVHPDDQELIQKLLAENIATSGNIVSVEYRYRHRNGSWRTLESIATNLLHDPDVRGIVINSRDITDRKEQEDALRTSNERFTNAFEYAAVGMALVSISGRTLKVNQALCNFLGYTIEEFARLTFMAVTHPDDLEQDLTSINRLRLGEIPFYHMEKRYIHKQGHVLWGQLAVSLVRDSDGKPVHFVSQIQDITERKLAEQRLIHDALHDSLTGLANRTMLADHIQFAFNRYLRHPDKPFALILADIDRFKNINDTRGHIAGDLVLLEVAKRLKEAVRPSDTVARLGGDEFAILLEDISGENNPTRIARRLLNEMCSPVNLRGPTIDVNLSMGVVVVTANHTSTEDVFRDADIALYRAKNAGRGNFQVFDQEMHKRIRERMELEADLRHAIERGETSIFLQPIIDLHSGSIIAFEALTRWNHPQKGYIPPPVFISMAEEMGYIDTLGTWVTTEVCRLLKEWPGSNPPPISINVSSAEIIRSANTLADYTSIDGAESFDQRMLRLVTEHNIPPHLLRIEITESVLIEDLKYATRVLDNLVSYGFKMLLDDFGTGYSSFSYLQDLPFYQVKLDSIFTERIQAGNRSYKLMEGIITLAHNVGLKVVAEGIETATQLDLVRKANCDSAQGYHIARPLPIHKAYEIYSSGRVW